MLTSTADRTGAGVAVGEAAGVGGGLGDGEAGGTGDGDDSAVDVAAAERPEPLPTGPGDVDDVEPRISQPAARAIMPATSRANPVFR
jgi:hypothetical protein